MKPMKHGLSAFFKDATGMFSMNILIAVASFFMLCYIVVKEKDPKPFVVLPFTLICLSQFVADPRITQIVARQQSGVPDTVVNTETTNLDSQQTTITPTPEQPS